MAAISLSGCFHHNSILINSIIIFNNANKHVMLHPYSNLTLSVQNLEVQTFLCLSSSNCYGDTEQIMSLNSSNYCFYQSVFC